MLRLGGNFWGVVLSINVGEDDMKLVFVAKMSLLKVFMKGGPLDIYHPFPSWQRCFKL
jgi:hypothetical protein